MSSKARRTVLFPEPESPVRITSWRVSRRCRGGGFTESGSAFYTALVRAGNAHVFSIFRDRAARDVYAPVIQLLGDLLVGEGLGGVFLLDHLLDHALQRQQRHAAALRPIHRLAEEGAELQDALRRVRIFASYGSAYRRRVYANFFRHFLDHHRLERVRTLIQKFSLPSDDGLANAKNGVLSLLDVFHQLHGCGEALLHVVAHVSISGIFDKQTPVRGTQAQLRHVVFVQIGLPLAVYFAEVNVWLDQARFGFVVAQARPGIELLDDVDGALHDFQRAVQGARNFLELVGLHLLQMLGNNLLSQRVLRIKRLQLQQQALTQIPRANSHRIEFLNHRHGVVQVVLGVFPVLGELFRGGGQISVLIQVTDDVVRDLPHCVRADGHA